MKILSLQMHSYEMCFSNAKKRSGVYLNIIDDMGNSGWGEIAPLPNWSKETLDESIQQLNQKYKEIIDINWTAQNCFKDLAKLNLLPSVLFGLESALIAILSPLDEFSISSSALLMGSAKEIKAQAELRHAEGYTSAKLKVSNLDFKEAAELIHQLKDIFRLRIDVNRVWNTSESLQFFSQFPLTTFDYVEEPFQNPQDLALFPHPLAIDESYPGDISIEKLGLLPTLKALIYKPTIQGGMLKCLSLHDWTTKKGISLVLSGSFESELGLAHIASIANRLSLTAPIGLGTYHFVNRSFYGNLLKFSKGHVSVPACLTPMTTLGESLLDI